MSCFHNIAFKKKLYLANSTKVSDYTSLQRDINKTISPEKHDSSREESLISLREGGWAIAESQRGMTQDEVKIVCQGARPWKTGTFLIGRVELFTRGWVSCCWVPKKNDAGNEKNDCMTDEENRKEKYKHHVSCNLT